MQLVYDLAIMFLGFYPREMKPYIHIDFLYKYTGQFYLQEPQIRNNSYDLEWNECINKLWHIPTIVYLTQQKKRSVVDMCNNLDEPPEMYAE